MTTKITLPTIAGLMIGPATKLAHIYSDTKDWKSCKDEALESNLMQIDKIASSKRYLEYTISLLKKLSEKEIEAFTISDSYDQKAFMWIAFCRSYPIITKFAETVINQKFNRNDYNLSFGDWYEFLSQESIEHTEIDDIGKATRVKAKSVLFGNLRSSGYLSSTNTLNEAIISKKTKVIIKKDLVLFPIFWRNMDV